MKGFAISFAILGFCIQQSSAAFTRTPNVDTTGIEANSFPEKIETRIFDENDYSTPTKEHIEVKSLLKYNLITSYKF